MTDIKFSSKPESDYISLVEKLPKPQDLASTVFLVLVSAGKPMANSEIEQAVIKELNIPTHLIGTVRSGNRTELQYRLAWARTYAKSKGMIRRTSPNTWESI